MTDMKPRITVADKIRATLKDFPAGLTARKIFSEISKTYATEMATITQQLSIMSRKGDIVKAGDDACGHCGSTYTTYRNARGRA